MAASPTDRSGSLSGSGAGTGPDTVLLVAHGSRNPAAAIEHDRLCIAVQESLGLDGASVPTVRAAYLELTEPSIPSAIDAAAADGAQWIRVLPHFLSPGNHVVVDLPRIVDEASTRHPSVRLELAEHLGADPELVTLLARRAVR